MNLHVLSTIPKDLENQEADAAALSGPRTASSIRQRKISKTIPFVRDERGDYTARIGSTRYMICKSTDGFGLSIHRDDGKELQRDNGRHGIAWFGTVSRCVRRAEQVLAGEQSAATSTERA